jgi:hypothetical protein
MSTQKSPYLGSTALSCHMGANGALSLLKGGGGAWEEGVKPRSEHISALQHSVLTQGGKHYRQTGTFWCRAFPILGALFLSSQATAATEHKIKLHNREMVCPLFKQNT